MKKIGNKQYSVQKFQGEHKDEYVVMEVKNGVPNGLAQLFNNGLIQMSWRMVDGNREGALTIYENGIVSRMIKWECLDELSDMNVIREVVNDMSGIRVMVEKSSESGVIIYRGGYNSKTLGKCGYGIEYDEETGVEKSTGYYCDDRLVHIHQLFVPDHENNGKLKMMEFDGDESVDNVGEVVNRHPIYVGGYRLDTKANRFVRSGKGYAIDLVGGICDYVSEWDENGEEVDGCVRKLFGGWYGEGEYDQSIRVSEIDEQIMENEKLERIEMFQTKWNDQLAAILNVDVINIHSIEEFVICNGAMNEKYNEISNMKLDLSEFTQLRTISIGNNSFMYVREFLIDGLGSLEKIRIGHGCFSISDEERGDGICRITNCPSLCEVVIGKGSFEDYKQFEISDVDSLRCIEFNEKNTYINPGNFVYADCIIKGM